MKHLFTLAFGLLLSVLSGCAGDRDDGAIAPEFTTLEVRFPGLTVAPPTTKAGTYPAGEAEKFLRTVKLCVFSDNGGTPGTLTAVLPVALGAAGTDDAESGVTGQCDLSSLANGRYYLLAVANHPTLSVADGVSFADFCRTAVTLFPTAASDFVMTGAPVAFDYDAATVPASPILRLTRLACRIDIQNDAAADTYPFELTAVRLRNAVDRSYLVKTGATQRIGANDAADKALDWVAWTPQPSVDRMFAALYTFENDRKDGDETQTGLEIRGVYRGSDVQFTIPFGDKAMVRNHRYLVRISQVDDGEYIQYDVSVADWDEGIVLPVDPTLPRPAYNEPVITGIRAYNKKWVAQTAFGPYEGMLFRTASGDDATSPDEVAQITVPFWRQRLEFALECDGGDIEVVLKGCNDLSGSWIDESASNTAHAVSETDGVYRRTVRLVFEANDLPGEEFRELTLRFRHADDPAGTWREVLIRQVYLPSVMNRLSRANVGELNRFADELTEDNFASTAHPGYHYQWGRNVPIRPSKTYTPLQAAIAWGTNHQNLWNENVLIGGAGLELYAGDQTGGDSWSSKVRKAKTLYGAPETYVGENSDETAAAPGATPYGDPCPKGWHLPSRSEYFAFAISSKGTATFDKFRFNCTAQSTSQAEGTFTSDPYSGVQWDYWTRKSPTAHYKSTGTATVEVPYNPAAMFRTYGAMYAIKFVSTASNDVFENALRGAFRCELLNKGTAADPLYYCKITYRHLGEKSTATLATISSAAYWNSNAANDVTAILPLYGEGSSSATSGYANDAGYYYTSEIRQYAGTPPHSPAVLLIGGPNDEHTTTYMSSTLYTRQTVSLDWNLGTAQARMLRCIENAKNPEIPAAAMQMPW